MHACIRVSMLLATPTTTHACPSCRPAQISMAYVVMAYIALPYTVMACVAMADVVLAYVIMAVIVMPCTVVVYINVLWPYSYGHVFLFL